MIDSVVKICVTRGSLMKAKIVKKNCEKKFRHIIINFI